MSAVFVPVRPPIPTAGAPPTPCRALIDATERDVALVLVGGEPLSGEVGLMSTLEPGDYEAVASPVCRCALQHGVKTPYAEY